MRDQLRVGDLDLDGYDDIAVSAREEIEGLGYARVYSGADGTLMYAVKNGYGDNWGTFGGPEYLVRMANCPISNLREYNYQTSLENVDISFGANRVDKIELIRVRLYYTDGNVVTIPLNLRP